VYRVISSPKNAARHAVKGKRWRIERIGSYSLSLRCCKDSRKKGAVVKMAALPPPSASTVPKANRPKPVDMKVPKRTQLEKSVNKYPHLISLARSPKIESILANLSIPDPAKSKVRSADSNIRTIGNQIICNKPLSESIRGANAMPSNWVAIRSVVVFLNELRPALMGF
jgi:hypothetical protein